MISLAALAELHEQYAEYAALPVSPLLIGDQVYDVDRRPVLMGCVNLSRDSTYRESIAPTAASAVRKARTQAAAGADLVDIGAESSTAKASRIDPERQAAALVPVVRALADHGVAVSAETYHPTVARAALEAGAQIVNLTGAAQQEEVFDLVAEHQATLILCRVVGGDVRDIGDVPLDRDPLPDLVDHFGARVDKARAHGVERIVIDPGMGFYYGNLVDPATRVRHQASVLLHTLRLRVLGLPIGHALPHAFDLFEDEFRSAEAFFAVLAGLGGTGLMRTHEVPRVRAVLDAMAALDVTTWPSP